MQRLRPFLCFFLLSQLCFGSTTLSLAQLPDGSCLFPGGTDPEAGNFSSVANLDDGSCGEGCNPADLNTCSSDSNGDGQANVTDLLTLVGEFGNKCE